MRHLPAVEALGSATVICTDKTGTLTLNQLRVEELDWQGEGRHISHWHTSSHISAGKTLFLRALRLTHSLSQNKVTPTTSGDPLERALVEFAQNFDHVTQPSERLAEIPFDDSRRRQSIITYMNSELMLLCKGAPEVIVELSEFYVTEDASRESIANKKSTILRNATAYAERGFKVLAYGQRSLKTAGAENTIDFSADKLSEFAHEKNEQHLEFLGLVALADPLRPEVQAAVEDCRLAGLKVIMVTGDHPETARTVALLSGIFTNPRAKIINGLELDHWTDAQLQLALGQPEVAFARVRANQKLRVVRALQDKKEIVAVTGDGVNDAPALRHAHVGVAMGRCGTDVARESADVVLLDDNFATIVAAIKEGRAVFRNIRNFLTYILSSNVPEAVPLILYIFLPIPLPLTIIQILAIDLGTDLLPAIGLGSEPSEASLTKNHGKSKERKLLDVPLLMKAYIWLGLWEAVVALCAFFFMLYLGGWSFSQPLLENDKLTRQAATATFVSVIFMQVANVFICRTLNTPKRASIFKNKILIGGVLLELAFIPTVLYVQPVRDILGTAPIPKEVILLILSLCILFIIFEFIRQSLSKRIFTHDQ